MTKEQLIAKAKLRIRKTSSDMLDEDVGQLVEVALADLKRIGVHSSYLDETDIKDPLIIEAVLLVLCQDLVQVKMRFSSFSYNSVIPDSK